MLNRGSITKKKNRRCPCPSPQASSLGRGFAGEAQFGCFGDLKQFVVDK